MSQGDFLDWLNEDYGDRYAAEETAREQGWLASGANQAAAAFAARAAELRAAARQAAAGHEAITAALSVADPS